MQSVILYWNHYVNIVPLFIYEDFSNRFQLLSVKRYFDYSISVSCLDSQGYLKLDDNMIDDVP